MVVIRKIQSAEAPTHYKDTPKLGYIYFAPENLVNKKPRIEQG